MPPPDANGRVNATVMLLSATSLQKVQAQLGPAPCEFAGFVASKGMVEHELVDLVEDVLKRTPAWLRRELSSTDDSMRERAEAALTAMVAAAVVSAIRSSAEAAGSVAFSSTEVH